MTNKEIAPILVALKSKPAQTSLTEEQFDQVYLYVLKPVPSEHAAALLRWVLLTCRTWRPTTDQIHDYSQRLAGCVSPDGAAVVSEIRAAIARFGKYGATVPGRRLHLLGTPQMSYEALRFVEARGGWQTLLDSGIGSEEIFWHEAGKEAAALCETIRIERERAAITARAISPALKSPLLAKEGVGGGM